MASGHSLPQINLSVQGGTQGCSYKLTGQFFAFHIWRQEGRSSDKPLSLKSQWWLRPRLRVLGADLCSFQLEIVGGEKGPWTASKLRDTRNVAGWVAQMVWCCPFTPKFAGSIPAQIGGFLWMIIRHIKVP
ncbi:hypothetical protein TNCV_23031 [Trichonephila clavipes]|nr:hypothetical protein TNCV_23031 [Trichonephila clavipes]